MIENGIGKIIGAVIIIGFVTCFPLVISMVCMTVSTVKRWRIGRRK